MNYIGSFTVQIPRAQEIKPVVTSQVRLKAV
jgi:hypothetical protein